ncbi:MAG: GreA/GreB family elongation factor [Candidatus Pacebacteria bacterium]|jgi:transcription elongation factor GreA|nr:GreA/GreB family elongation factor [Candidatus Paceibacterota bacterium]
MIEEKNFYLTREGLKKIKREYEELKQMKLSKTKGEAPVILHSEDVNPEYLALQEDLGLLDIKLADLEVILKNAKLIKAPAKTMQDAVGLGATVMVDTNGRENEFTIVGTLEANPSEGKISNESPVGKILLGKKIGEKVALPTNGNNYKIKKISYNIS